LANPVVSLFGALRLKPILTEAGQDLDSLERKASHYGTYTRYLQLRDRTEYLNEVESLLRRIEYLQSWAFLASRSNRAWLRSLRSKANTLKTFLEGFPLEYVNAEVKRRKGFFDRTRLDPEQTAAVVKDPSHHLVLAAAGSGKTKTLTARIALLMERGVPQEQILALAYTRAAAT